MATAGVLEKSEKKAFLDDTTPLTAIFITHRVVPKQNYVVRGLGPTMPTCTAYTSYTLGYR